MRTVEETGATCASSIAFTPSLDHPAMSSASGDSDAKKTPIGGYFSTDLEINPRNETVMLDAPLISQGS